MEVVGVNDERDKVCHVSPYKYTQDLSGPDLYVVLVYAGL